MNRRGAAAVVAAAALFGCAEDDGPVAPGEPDPEGAGRIVRIEALSAPAANGTYLVGEEIRFGAWVSGGETVAWTGSVWLVFEAGLAREPAELRAVEGERLEFAYRVRRGDYDGDGISVPEGDLEFGPGASLTVSGGAVDPRVPGLETDGGHRIYGTFEPGETVVFDAATEQLPAPPAADGQAVGCRDLEEVEGLVRSVLAGDLFSAAVRFETGYIAGQCAELAAGEEAIFLAASVFEDGGDVVDLVLAYGPGFALAGEETANWWTLGDFVEAAE